MGYKKVMLFLMTDAGEFVAPPEINEIYNKVRRRADGQPDNRTKLGKQANQMLKDFASKKLKEYIDG